MRWEIDEGLEGAHYIMFSVLLLSLKNNIYQSSPFSSKRQSAPTERLRRHIPAPRGNAHVQTVIQNLLAGPLNILCICIVSAARLTLFTLPVGLFYSVWEALGGLLCNKSHRRGAASAR